MKKWFSKQWSRFKGWVYGILVTLGIIAGGVALAVPTDFSWTNPTTNVDGSIFNPATEQSGVRLYCGTDPAGFVPETPDAPQTETPTAVSVGDANSMTVDLLPGTHDCFATVMNIYGQESMPSNIVTKTVDRFPPSPPVLDQ